MAATATRTALLMAALIALLGVGGWAFGGSNGLAFMLVLGLAMNLGAYWFSDRIARLAHRARPILSWLSTHPPIEERIARLRAMTGHVPPRDGPTRRSGSMR